MFARILFEPVKQGGLKNLHIAPKLPAAAAMVGVTNLAFTGEQEDAVKLIQGVANEQMVKETLTRLALRGYPSSRVNCNS